jgi:DNA-binding response OmpR family regulator
MDDNSYWREELTDILSQASIKADSAAKIAEVQRLIEENCYQLLVLDIRMDDDDPQNEEGSQLLRELHTRGLNEVFKVVMITAQGDLRQMRAAFTQQQVDDFLDKGDFKTEEFLQRVQDLLTKLGFRADLVIHWQPIDAPQQLVSGLALGTLRVIPEEPALVSRAISELEDLLCRLFQNANSLIVQPLAPGFSGAKVLQAQPFVEQRGTRPVVVKFGEYDKIEQECRNYDTYVQPFFGGRSTTLLGRRRTVHLGGIVYSLLDAADDRVRNFDQFYRDANPRQIRQVLEGLFFGTCREWYANLEGLLPCDLSEEYQRSLNFTEEWLARVLADQLDGVDITASGLTFRAMGATRVFTNPFAAMAQQHIIRPTYRCITHGDLNQRNVLVDDTRRAWLIDFARTGPSHFLRDILLLDSVVRFELLAGNEATLDDRLHLEELLLATEGKSEAQRLKAATTLHNSHVEKAFAVTTHLRSLAKQLGPKRLRYDRSGYAEGLMYTAMNAVKFHQMPMVQREHALLCASLMADVLKG